MLTRRLMVLILLATTYLVFTPVAAHADYIYCPPDNGPCVIRAGNPGGGGGPGGGGSSGGGGGGSARCRLEDEDVFIPCYRDSMGWFNHTNGCYYNQLELSLNDPRWGSNDPTKGKLYAVYCWNGASAGWVPTGPDYLFSEPPGYGGQPTPMQVATDAINLLPLIPPDIGVAPSPSGSGLVGLPVWMWTNTNPNPTWVTADNKLHRWVQDQGVRVDAWAYSSHITWFMGDGAEINCWNPGDSYEAAKKDNPSPSCGYVYKKRGTYTITAVTSWEIHWEGGGTSADLVIFRESTVTVRIEELQVVNQ